jgi:hypothetical protein
VPGRSDTDEVKSWPIGAVASTSGASKAVLAAICT